MEKLIKLKNNMDIDQIIQLCQKGENEHHICQLIRQDSVNDFISYICQLIRQDSVNVFNRLKTIGKIFSHISKCFLVVISDYICLNIVHWNLYLVFTQKWCN